MRSKNELHLLGFDFVLLEDVVDLVHGLLLGVVVMESSSDISLLLFSSPNAKND